MEWKEYKLGDVCEITSSKRIFYSEYEDSGVPFYRSKEIINLFNKQEIATELFISEERYKEIKEKFGVPQKNDILLTSVGSIGIPYLVKENDKFYFKDGNLTWIRNYDARKIDPLFLYIWIISEVGKRTLEILSMGAAQAALTISRLKEAKIFLPSINEQRAIASILSNYDTLIDTNTKRIKLLEESARELYKEWFVRMRFPGYEQTKFVKGIPEGWKVVELKELVTTQYGLTKTAHSQRANDNDAYYLRITDIVDNNINWAQVPYCSTDDDVMRKYKLYQGDILVARTGATVGYATQIQGIPYEAVFASYLIRLKAKNKLHISYIGMSVVSDIFRDYIQSVATGAAQPMANPHLMTSFKLLLPSEYLLKQFNGYIDSINYMILYLQLQNQELASTRDRLLPRLLSGELKVKA